MTETSTESFIDNSNNDEEDDDEVIIIPYVKPPPPLVILESDDDEELSKDLDQMRLTSSSHSKPLKSTGSIINQEPSSSPFSLNSGATDKTTQTKSNDLASTTIVFFFPKGRLRGESFPEMLEFLTGLEKEYMVKIQPRSDETEGRGSISISGVSSAVSDARTQIQQWLKEQQQEEENVDKNNKENANYDDECQILEQEEKDADEVPVCMRTRKQQKEKRKEEQDKQEASLLIDRRLCRNVNEFELLMKRLRHVCSDLYVVLKPRMEYNGLRVVIETDRSGQFQSRDRQQQEIVYAKTRLQTWINTLASH